MQRETFNKFYAEFKELSDSSKKEIIKGLNDSGHLEFISLWVMED